MEESWSTPAVLNFAATQQQHAILASVIETKDLDEELTLPQFLAAVAKAAKKSDKSQLRLFFDLRRFHGNNPEQFGAEIKVELKDLRPQMTVRQLLEHGLAKAGVWATIVLRAMGRSISFRPAMAFGRTFTIGKSI